MLIQVMEDVLLGCMMMMWGTRRHGRRVLCVPLTTAVWRWAGCSVPATRGLKHAAADLAAPALLPVRPAAGKTLVARALASHASRYGGRKVSFYMRKGADVLSKWVGEAERQVREPARRGQGLGWEPGGLRLGGGGQGLRLAAESLMCLSFPGPDSQPSLQPTPPTPHPVPHPTSPVPSLQPPPQLRLLFEEAQRNAPAIIFFDEIDGLAPVRRVWGGRDREAESLQEGYKSRTRSGRGRQRPHWGWGGLFIGSL